jgi:multicomponent Na+:H+ antiporter subunit E
MIARAAALALAWCALTGTIGPFDLAFGMVLGWIALRIGGVGKPVTAGLDARRAAAAVSLLVFFLWELLVANIRVAAAVLGPSRLVRPGIVAVPLELTSDAGISLLANMITLTPGTLSLDVSADRKTLYVHCLAVDDPEEAVRSIKDGFERRVRRVLP